MEACGPARGLPGAMPCKNVHWPSTSPMECCDMLSVNPSATLPVGPLAVHCLLTIYGQDSGSFFVPRWSVPLSVYPCVSLLVTVILFLLTPSGWLLLLLSFVPVYSPGPSTCPFVPGPFQSVGEISYHWKPIQRHFLPPLSHTSTCCM